MKWGAGLVVALMLGILLVSVCAAFLAVEAYGYFFPHPLPVGSN
jgi:hypothetical protein